MPDPRPLRVVEVGMGLAGSVCGRLFAGLGHEVVRCEPRAGDGLRRQPPLGGTGDGLMFVELNADKSSALVEGASGRAAVRDLLRESDVAVVDLPADGARDFGLTAEGLREDFPDLVVVWISGFGLAGTYADMPADSLLAEAYGGLATMIGDASDRPLSLGGEQMAYCSGVAGFMGAMLALKRRDASLGGDIVEVAMCDVAAYMDWKSDLGYAMTGEAPKRSGTNPGDWRLVRARDGWVGFIFQSQHWPMVVELVGAPELSDPALSDEAARRARGSQWWPAVERWTRERSAEEVYKLAQARGLPFGWVARPSDLARSAQLLSRGFIVPDYNPDDARPVVGSPVRADGLPWRRGRAPRIGERPAPAAGAPSHPPAGEGGPAGKGGARARPSPVASGQPLAGVRVLDFGTITAGAAVTRLLADYGASVIKVEWLDHPDTFRSWKMPLVNGNELSLDSPYFMSNNVGKLGLAVNLKSHDGQRIIHQLASRCHVVVENYRVGVTQRLGIDADTLHAINPDLLYLSLSSQGESGPEAHYSSYGSTLDLLSGLASITGYEPDHPLWSSSDVNYPDQLVSLFGAAFVSYCLQRDIRGIHLDMSQREIVSWTLGTYIADFLANQNDAVPAGNRRPGRSPHDTYPCLGHDTWVAISCETDRHRDALAACVGSARLRGHGGAWWKSNEDLVDQIVAAWTRRHDRSRAVAKLRAAGVPSVPVLNAADRVRDPRFASRQVVLSDAGMPVKGLPIRFHRHDVQPALKAPALGENTREILGMVGGFPDSVIDEYEARGVVYCGPLPDASGAVPGGSVELSDARE